MTIVECVNEKTALNLNPFQVFVFLNQRKSSEVIG